VIAVLVFVCAAHVANCTPGRAVWKQQVLGVGSFAEACETGRTVARNTGVGGHILCAMAPSRGRRN
jgi:hypothetical protein